MQLICALLKTRVIFAPVAKQNLHKALLQVAFAVWQVKKSIDAEPIEEGSMPPLSAVIWAGSALNVKHLQQLQEAIAEEAASLHCNDYPRDFIECATAAAIASSASTAPVPVPPAKPVMTCPIFPHFPLIFPYFSRSVSFLGNDALDALMRPAP